MASGSTEDIVGDFKIDGSGGGVVTWGLGESDGGLYTRGCKVNTVGCSNVSVSDACSSVFDVDSGSECREGAGP